MCRSHGDSMENTEQPPGTVSREPPLVIAAFWLTILLSIPACDILFAVSLGGSPTQFGMAALAGTATLATIVGLMIRYVGFHRSPIRISILLALTLFFAIIHGFAFLNWINRTETQVANTTARFQDLTRLHLRDVFAQTTNGITKPCTGVADPGRIRVPHRWRQTGDGRRYLALSSRHCSAP